MSDLLSRYRLYFQAGFAAVFALCACLTIFLYFRALRYRRGTTQWFARLDPRFFAPPVRQRLHGLDLLRAPLAAGLGVALYLGREYLLTKSLPTLTCEALFPLGCCCVLVIGMYLLLRILCNSPLAALCAAALVPVSLPDDLITAALVALMLLSLGLWLTRRGDAAPLGGIVYFAAAGLSFVLALREPLLLWLAPIFPMVWIAVQIIRWRKCKGKHRLLRLLLSSVLTVLCLASCVVLRCVLPITTIGQLLEDLERCTNLPVLWQTLRGSFPEFFPLSLRASFRWTDVPLLLAAVAAMIPLLHSTFSRRDSRGFVLMALLIPFVCLWLFADLYLLPLPLLLIMGWLWSILSLRKRSGSLLFSAGTLLLFIGIQFSITLF